MKSRTEAAAERLAGVVTHTPLQYNQRLSEKYAAAVYLKREDLQVVRSYKLRGAYNKISKLTEAERAKGVICASAGNHARSEEHTSELQSLMRISYAVFCLKKKKNKTTRFT